MDSRIKELIGNLHAGIKNAGSYTFVQEGESGDSAQQRFSFKFPFESNYEVYFTVAFNKKLGHGDVIIFIDSNKKELKGALFQNCTESFELVNKTLNLCYGLRYTSMQTVSKRNGISWILFTF